MKTALIYGNEALVDHRIHHIALKQQINSIKIHCYKNNYEILGIYTDEESGGLDKPGLQQMLQDIHQKKIQPDVIFVKYWRYLTSDTHEMLSLIDALYNEGIQVISIHDLDEVWNESLFYKFKNIDLAESKKLKAKGIYCLPHSKISLSSLLIKAHQ